VGVLVPLDDGPRRELLPDYLERFMKHVEVDDEEYAKQGFVDVF
jgi:hypothetical protein